MSVYFDYNATTRVAPEAFEAMLPFLRGDCFGNPSSVHRYGRQTKQAMEQARAQVAELAGAHPGQIIFTASGTEANNLALRGVTRGQAPAHIAISAIEHSSVRESAFVLREEGWQVDEIPVDARCQVLPQAVEAMLKPETRFLSVMLANNETGVIQDIAPIAALARAAGVCMHSDATQAAGKIPLDFAASGVKMLTLSSHKLYGPLGAGALIVDKQVSLKAHILGGTHERGLRAGTENVAAIVGFGAAAELAKQQLEQRHRHMLALRERIEDFLRTLPGVVIFAADAPRLPNTLQFGVRGFHGETLLMQLDQRGIAVSSGSACRSGTHHPSHVLAAMGVETDLALTAVRVSLGQNSSEHDTEQFIRAINGIVNRE